MCSRLRGVAFLKFLSPFMDTMFLTEASKHLKRSVENMSYDHLQTLSSALCRRLEASYWKQRQFVAFKQHVDMLAGNIAQYCDYLKSQSKKMKLVHSSETSVRQISDSLTVEVLKGSSTCFPCLNDLSTALQRMDTYYHLSVNEFCPPEAQPRYRFLQQLKCGLNVSIVLLTYSPGNNKGNLHFAWRYDHSEAIETVFQRSLPVVETVKTLLPQYHTRAMRKSFLKVWTCIYSCEDICIEAFLQGTYWRLLHGL